MYHYLETKSEPQKVIETLLNGQRGVYIAEEHDEQVTSFVVDRMPDLARCGVKVLFCEVPSIMQPLLDDFHNGSMDESKFLKTLVGTLGHVAQVWMGWQGISVGRQEMEEDYRARIMPVLRAAKAAKIRVVGMDVPHRPLDFDDFGPRVQTSNPHWIEVCQRHIAKLAPDEKYAVYGGMMHFSAGCSEEIAIPVDRALGIPGVCVLSSGERETALDAVEDDAGRVHYILCLAGPEKHDDPPAVIALDDANVNKAIKVTCWCAIWDAAHEHGDIGNITHRRALQKMLTQEVEKCCRANLPREMSRADFVGVLEVVKTGLREALSSSYERFDLGSFYEILDRKIKSEGTLHDLLELARAEREASPMVGRLARLDGEPVLRR